MKLNNVSILVTLRFKNSDDHSQFNLVDYVKGSRDRAVGHQMEQAIKPSGQWSGYTSASMPKWSSYRMCLALPSHMTPV